METEKVYTPQDKFPHVELSNGDLKHFTVGDSKYALLLFPIRADRFKTIQEVVAKTLKGNENFKYKGPTTGWILDLHVEHRPIRDAAGKALPPVLHRERWYPTREKMEEGARELCDFLNSLTIEEAFNLNLPDFHCPRAGSQG